MAKQTAAVMEVSPIDLSKDRAEMERRKRFLLAMVSVTGVRNDQLATRVRYAARNRQMDQFEASAESKIAGVLDAAVMVALREWGLIVEVLAAACRTTLRNELVNVPREPAGLSSIFNREEKQQKDRRALILSCSRDLSGMTLAQLAARVARGGVEFSTADEAEQAATAVIDKTGRVSPGQWLNLSHVFIGAAMQGLEREEAAAAAERVDPEPGQRAEQDARLMAACMAIGAVTLQQAVQRVSYIGRSFGIESLSDSVPEKLLEVIEARCVMTEIERAAILRVFLMPAAQALEAELITGRESTAPAARFADMIRGSLKLLDLSVDNAAPNVMRLAGRWFLGRLETQAAELLKQFLGDSGAVEFTTDERHVIAHALFAVPLRMLKAELEVCK